MESNLCLVLLLKCYCTCSITPSDWHRRNTNVIWGQTVEVCADEKYREGHFSGINIHFGQSV